MGNENQENTRSASKWLSFPRIATVIALLLLALLVYGVWRDGGKDLSSGLENLLKLVGEVNLARGLITFLVVLGTVAIAVLVVTYGLFFGKDEPSQERFRMGKEVLTVFMTLLGTIMGFYYAENRVSPENVQQIANTVQKPTPKPIADIEKKGFDALFAKDFDSAVKAFAEAYEVSPEWRNVDELLQILTKEKAEMAKAPDKASKDKIWDRIYCKINTDKRTEAMSKELIAQIQAAKCNEPPTGTPPGTAATSTNPNANINSR